MHCVNFESVFCVYSESVFCVYFDSVFCEVFSLCYGWFLACLLPSCRYWKSSLRSLRALRARRTPQNVSPSFAWCSLFVTGAAKCRLNGSSTQLTILCHSDDKQKVSVAPRPRALFVPLFDKMGSTYNAHPQAIALHAIAPLSKLTWKTLQV